MQFREYERVKTHCFGIFPVLVQSRTFMDANVQYVNKIALPVGTKYMVF